MEEAAEAEVEDKVEAEAEVKTEDRGSIEVSASAAQISELVDGGVKGSGAKRIARRAAHAIARIMSAAGAMARRPAGDMWRRSRRT
jgi:hypothetical protein